MTTQFEISRGFPFGVVVSAKVDAQSVKELSVDQLRELARQHHLVVLRGFATFESAEAFADYCGEFGEISVWPFGKVLELVEQENPTDHIFDNNYVPLHWDGMYRKQVPEFQMFHCVRAPPGGQGGRTTFSNTRIVLERALPQVRAMWSNVQGIYRRKVEHYDSKTVAPIITMHPVSGFPVIRYNEPPLENDATFLNHPDLSFDGVAGAKIEDFHRGLREALYAPESFYAHTWQTGDIVISDNYTLLHGREAFTRGCARHLRRVHVLGQPPLDNPHLVSYS